MLKVLLFTLIIIAISMALLSVKLILKPGSKFSSMHIGDSEAMKKRKIHCVQSMDAMERKENPHRIPETRE